MDFSIDQLADLKIAIKKNEAILSEKEKANKILESRNKDLISTNSRLDKEIDVQVKRIEESKAKNIEISAEKEGILSKFAIDNEKVYKELREKEKSISNEAQQTALRLIELDKREWKLANKEKANNLILEEARNISKETKNEAVSIESRLLDLEASKKNLEAKRKSVTEREDALISIKEKLEKTRILNSDKESDIMELEQKNSNTLIQIQSKEKLMISDKERLEKLIPLFTELKNFVIENGKISIEDIEKILWDEAKGIEDENKGTEEEPVIETKTEEIVEEDKGTEEVIETEFNIETASYAEMLAEAKLRDPNLNGQPKKAVLIELLSK